MSNKTTLAVALAIALGTPYAQAASRITASVDTKANVTLTAEEQRAVSVAAGRLLRHAYKAQQALGGKDKKNAAAEIVKAQKLVAIIEHAVPSFTVKSTIAAGDLSYEDEDMVKPNIIRIFDELDKVSLVAPLRQAKAEKNKKAKGEEKVSPVGVVDDVLENVRVTMDLGLAKAGLERAKAKLDKEELEAAEEALAAVSGSLHFSLLEVDLPLDRARENLMLAKTAIEAGDTVEAKAVLEEADTELDAFAEGANKADKKAISTLRDEMKDLSGKLKTGDTDNNLVKTIEGWWDRLGKLMK